MDVSSRRQPIAWLFLLAALMLTAALPPIVADQSDRAILNAPITLLTTPIAGEISAFSGWSEEYEGG
jgi:hypothetical protein